MKLLGFSENLMGKDLKVVIIVFWLIYVVRSLNRPFIDVNTYFSYLGDKDTVNDTEHHVSLGFSQKVTMSLARKNIAIKHTPVL